MKSNKKNEEFFLETSVQIKSILGSNLLRQKIKEILGQDNCWSSFYILGEFKRSLISALIDFYFLVDNETNISEALECLSEYYQPRKIKFIISALSQITKRTGLKNKERFLLEIENLIENSLLAFELNINKNYIENKIKCDHSKVKVITDEKKSIKENYKNFIDHMSCRKGKTKCNCKEFIKDNKSSLVNLLEEENQNKYKNNTGYKDVIEKYTDIINDYKKAEGTNCKSIADTIIAIECPYDKTLLTLDTAFDALCPILNKKHKKLPSGKALKKEASLQP